jgi:hypothetical protein
MNNDTLNIITWWVYARVYESALDHQSDPGVHRWLYNFMRIMSDQPHLVWS